MPEKLTTPIAIIVAVAHNGVIGRDNTLPWRLPADLKHFKATTLGKPVVMGRKTFESLGKPLPGRTNIVVTRDAAFAADGVLVKHSLEEALQDADKIAVRDGTNEIMVIGGAEIYKQVLPATQTIYYTHVVLDIEGGDAFFSFDKSNWQLVDKLQFPAEGTAPAYELLRYQRAG